MPKMKTRKAVAKRFRLTKSGKVRPLGCSGTSHILSKKTSKRKRRLRKGDLIGGKQAINMRRLMGA